VHDEQFLDDETVALPIAATNGVQSHHGLDDNDQAFPWFNQADEGCNHWLVWLNRDPRWDRFALRFRFRELEKRVDYPVSLKPPDGTSLQITTTKRGVLLLFSGFQPRLSSAQEPEYGFSQR